VTGCQDLADQVTRDLDSKTVVSKNLFYGGFRHRVRFFVSTDFPDFRGNRFHPIEDLVKQTLPPGEIKNVNVMGHYYQVVWSFHEPLLDDFKRVAMMAKLSGFATNIKFEKCVLIEEIVAQASTDK
jgi:hypothetical protein